MGLPPAEATRTSTMNSSFAGIGLGRGDPANILARVMKSQKATRNWVGSRVLVLDEISMCSAELFDLLDFIGKSVRQNSAQAFGGIRECSNGLPSHVSTRFA